MECMDAFMCMYRFKFRNGDHRVYKSALNDNGENCHSPLCELHLLGHLRLKAPIFRRRGASSSCRAGGFGASVLLQN